MNDRSGAGAATAASIAGGPRGRRAAIGGITVATAMVIATIIASTAVIFSAIDRIHTSLDNIEAGQRSLQAALDRLGTALDRLGTALDRLDTEIDRLDIEIGRLADDLERFLDCIERRQSARAEIETSVEGVETAAGKPRPVRCAHEADRRPDRPGAARPPAGGPEIRREIPEQPFRPIDARGAARHDYDALAARRMEKPG